MIPYVFVEGKVKIVKAAGIRLIVEELVAEGCCFLYRRTRRRRFWA